MQQVNIEAGCVYDALHFLSHYSAEITEGTSPRAVGNPYYDELIERLAKNHIDIPIYLYPFITGIKGTQSFLFQLLFDDMPYDKCTIDSCMISLKNKGYLRRCYLEYYFPDISSSTAEARLLDFSGGMNFIRRYKMEPGLEFHVYYSVEHFQECTDVLAEVFEAVTRELSEMHEAYLERGRHLLAIDPVNIARLRTISGMTDDGANDPVVSLSLMAPMLIAYRRETPSHFLLGYDYETLLNSGEYQYYHLRPYNLAQALYAQTRNDIFEALLIKSPMTRAEIEKKLHVSRAALDHGLKEMKDNGILTVDSSQHTFRYSLNRDYLKAVGLQLLAAAGLVGL